VKTEPVWTEDELNPNVHCPYPKHRGVRWDIVYEQDPDYMHWLVSDMGPDMDEGMHDAIMEVLEEAAP